MNLRKRARLGRDERAYIDVVPLVDTLLAVFLFLAILAFQSPITFLAVKLPEVEKGETQRIRAARVQITERGALLLEGKPADIKGVREFLKRAKPEYLIVEADERAKHGTVVSVMDVAKGVGVENVIIAVRKKAR
ncbi:MAG TPA: biopolymer transporter ExbD [Aquificaceae bacterium]|nr:biopolymer transporter ExbD [Aquificaceae bacterium]HIQ31451.1 biopolymer transporter ExbD [Aquifex aeolicus]